MVENDRSLMWRRKIFRSFTCGSVSKINANTEFRRKSVGPKFVKEGNMPYCIKIFRNVIESLEEAVKNIDKFRT